MGHGLTKRENADDAFEHQISSRNSEAPGKGPSVHQVARQGGTPQPASKERSLELFHALGMMTEVHERSGTLEQVVLTCGASGVRMIVEDPAARFAYDVLPDGTVRIVATPGVRIATFEALTRADVEQGSITRLVPEIIRVQDPGQVPVQGHAVIAERFMDTRVIGGVVPHDPQSALIETRGREGVTIRESVTGVTLRIHPRDSSLGARFAYQIVAPGETPEARGKAEIRVLVGPGTRVEITEPVPEPPLATETVNTFGDRNVELVLYETEQIEVIPLPGQPLDSAFMVAVGRPRLPDARSFKPLSAGQNLALGAADMMTSGLPGVGDAIDLAEFARASVSGLDRHNRPVSTFELAIMGLAVILPFVGAGAFRAVGKGVRTAESLAARFGYTVDEMEHLLARASALTPQDRAAITRVDRVWRQGDIPTAEDLYHLRETLSHLGFTTDVPYTAGSIHHFPAPDQSLAEPYQLDAMLLGKSPETDSVHPTTAYRAGISRPPRHHVLPREHRRWFEERGFVGDRNIDNYCIELDEATHQAIHGGGNWHLGHGWERSWNRRVMSELKRSEKALSRKLRPKEILRRIQELMAEYGLEGPFVSHRSR